MRFLGILIVTTFLFSTTAFSKLEIKLAILAPEGSAWVNSLRAIDQELREKTGGEVSFKLYPGGTAGDEKDVIRKMKIGQLNAAGFTGNGLGEVLPMVRILELPMLFRDNKEVDFITSRLRDRFDKAFLTKGKVLLGWAEAGYVYVFSKTPIASMNDMGRKIKMWVWENDRLAQETFKAFKVSPIPLALTDVKSSLHTELINAFYSSPLGAVAFQWFNEVKYMTQFPIVNATGALLINKKTYDKLSAKHQALLKEISQKHLKSLVKETREANNQSIDEFRKTEKRKKGITLIPVDPKEQIHLLNASKTVWDLLADDMYPRALLEETKTLLAEYRKQDVVATDKKPKGDEIIKELPAPKKPEIKGDEIIKELPVTDKPEPKKGK